MTHTAMKSTLALSSTMAHSFFDQHPDAVLVLDESGNVLLTNPAAAWLGPADSGDDDRSNFARMTGIVWPHDDGVHPGIGSRWNRRVRIQGADGVVRQVDVSVFGVERGEGEAPLYYCVLRDVTASVMAARAGLEGESRSKATSDSAPVLVWMCGTSMLCEWFNRSWLAFRGRSLGDELGEGWIEGVHPEDVDRCRSIRAHCFEQREPFSLDYRLKRHDGLYRWVLETGVPRIGHDGAFLGYIGTCVDIDDRKELENSLAERTRALRLSDRRREEFLAKLSHELRNPLGPIANAAAILRMFDEVDPRLATARAIIERQVGHLRRVITDLVDVTQITRGRVVLQRERIDSNALIDDAVEDQRSELVRREQTLHITRADERLVCIGDAQRLSQALAALIGNAAKFSSAGATIDITSRACVSDVMFEIVVHDSGRGIASDFMPHAFDLFAQGSADSATEGSLGVGLTIAKRIAELHGGDVRVESAGLGAGTTAVLRLPRSGAQERPPIDDLDLDLATIAGRRVLIIEDNIDALESLRMLVEINGNEVMTAANAEEGRRLALQFDPQLIVCDIGLPDGDGCDLVHELREALPGRDVRYVALTGFGRVEERDRALDSGFDSFLVKPLRSSTTP